MRNDTTPPKFISPLGPSHLPWSEGKPSKKPSYLEGPSLYQPPQQSNPSFKQTVKEGFGIGLGASVARNIVDSIFSSPTRSSSPTVASPTVASPTVASPTVASHTTPESKRCLPEKQSFDTCILERRDLHSCELAMKVYHDCLDSNNKQ